MSYKAQIHAGNAKTAICEHYNNDTVLRLEVNGDEVTDTVIVTKVDELFFCAASSYQHFKIKYRDVTGCRIA